MQTVLLWIHRVPVRVTTRHWQRDFLLLVVVQSLQLFSAEVMLVQRREKVPTAVSG